MSIKNPQQDLYETIQFVREGKEEDSENPFAKKGKKGKNPFAKKGEDDEDDEDDDAEDDDEGKENPFAKKGKKSKKGKKDEDDEEDDQVDEKLNPQQRNLKRAAQIKTGGREHGGQAAVQKKAGGDKGSSSKVQGGKQSQFTGVRHDSSRGDKTGARRDRTRGTNPDAPTHDKGNQSERPDQTKDARKGGFGGAKSTTVQKYKQHKDSVERAKNQRATRMSGRSDPKEDRPRRELKRELDARKKSLTKPKTESFDDDDNAIIEEIKNRVLAVLDERNKE